MCDSMCVRQQYCWHLVSFYTISYDVVVPCPLSPDDHSRVFLSVSDSTGNDYINASFIDVSVMEFQYLVI